jgi:hypothetical protein
MTELNDSHRADLRRFATIELSGVRKHLARELALFRATAKQVARWEVAVQMGIVIDGAVRALTPEEWDAACVASKAMTAGPSTPGRHGQSA